MVTSPEFFGVFVPHPLLFRLRAFSLTCCLSSLTDSAASCPRAVRHKRTRVVCLAPRRGPPSLRARESGRGKEAAHESPNLGPVSLEDGMG